MATQSYFNQNNFNAGQLSEKLHKRSDLTSYQNGVKESVNFLPQLHGPMYKRPGTRRVGTAYNNNNVRLVPFIFSSDDVYVLEFTPLKMRVYKNGALLAFSLTTTISASILPDFQYVQNGDTMYITHQTLAPQQLTRFGDTSWTIHTVGFSPPPMYEAGTAISSTMTMAAASGSSVNATAGATFWLDSDVNRFLVEKNGPGVAVITSITSTTVAVTNILTTFSDTSLASGEWLVLGSPSADLWINKSGLPGTIVTVDAYQDIAESGESNQVNDGTFTTGFDTNYWDNLSAPRVGTGTIDQDKDDGIAIDDGSFDFIANGIQENYYFENSDQGHRNYVAKVNAANTLYVDQADANFATGNTWICTQTGAAFLDNTNQKCTLNGERNGIGWIEQQILADFYDTTLGALSGSTTWTANTETPFHPGFIGATLHEVGGPGVATITDYNSTNSLDVTITTAFSTVALNNGVYTLRLPAPRVWSCKFRVEDSDVSMQIGSTSRASDIYSEKLFEVGEHEIYFFSEETVFYLQFRNNQQTNAAVADVSFKEVSIATFRSADVGKYIRVLGGVIEITSVDTSGKRCTGIIRSELVAAEETKDLEVVAGLWSLESNAWTSALGYPRVVALHDQRLYFGSSTEFPTTLWGSAISDFTNFNRGENDDDDSVVITPTSTEVNQFRWIMAEHNLAVGTGRNEFIVSPGLGDATITPTTRKVDVPSQWGSTVHRPVRVGEAIVFIERNATVIREMVTTASADVARSRDLTLLAEGIAAAGIEEIVFQQRPTPTLWGRLADGTVISGAYLQDEEVMGWVTHDFGGAVASLCVIPTDTTDQLWMAVDRFGGTSVEYMQERDAVYGNLVTDSTFIYEGTEVDEVDGLFWLEGKEVSIVVDGVEYPNQVVSCGHVGGLVPGVTYAEIGMPVEAQLILLDAETPQEMTTGYTINAVKVSLSLLDSGGGRLNGQRTYDVFEYPFGVEDGLYTGTLPFHGVNSDDGFLPDIVITHRDAKPFKLRAVTRLIESSRL